MKWRNIGQFKGILLHECSFWYATLFDKFFQYVMQCKMFKKKEEDMSIID